MMPYYGMPVGTEWEEVGFAFNKDVITGLLRNELGFDGIVCTDWGLIGDSVILGQPMPARAWGVEHLSELERARKIIDAGCDQFGGESRPELVVELVRSGRLSPARIDQSVRRLLREKFVLGLFDRRFLDIDHAVATIGRADFVAEGEVAQRAAMVWLTAADSGPAALLIRLNAPYEPRPGGFESFFHAGSLEFPAAQRDRIVAICKKVPTIIVLFLDRPAIVPEIAHAAAALLVEFGAQDDAVVDVLLGRAQARGRLPFDLPSSTRAVTESRSDVPYDTADPLFRFGDGIVD
jgi:beta-glucosidase